MVATPGRDDENPNPMSIYSEMSGVRTLQKQMKAMGKRHRKMMKANHGESAAKKLKRQISSSAELNRQLRAFDHDQFQRKLRKLNAGMYNASALNESVRALTGYNTSVYKGLADSINIDPPTVDMTPNLGVLAAMSKASYSDVDTAPLVNIPEPIVQSRGPEVGEASDEKLISELVDRGRFIACPECGEVDRAEDMELVPADEDATTEFEVVCRQCGSSDIGYQ